MPIEFLCQCGKKLRAPDGTSGKKAKCPKCESINVIPDAAAGDAESMYDFKDPPAPQAVARPAAVGAGESIAASGAGAGPVDEYDFKEPAPKPKPVVRAPVTPPVRPVAAAAIPPAALPQLATKPTPWWRKYAYGLLILALIPLLVSTFTRDDSTEQRIAKAYEDHEEEIDKALAQQLAKHSDLGIRELYDVVTGVFPGHKLEGALLARDTWGHWGFALAAAVGFCMLILFAFPEAKKFRPGLIMAGIFTGTIGILLLLGFQYAAMFTQGMWVRGSGLITIVFYIIKLIGLSYAAAENPENGFWLSFLGFTFGVGLCEEFTKSIPMLFRIRPIPGEEDATWKGLLVWGMASGIGFGIAEGIMYSSRYYNGIEGSGMYIVRFVSCVMLHAMWAGAVGVNLYKRQEWLLGAEHWLIYFFRTLQVVAVPMVLHGLYDTLLKKEMQGWALVAAVASFGWLAFQIESMRYAEARGELAAE